MKTCLNCGKDFDESQGALSRCPYCRSLDQPSHPCFLQSGPDIVVCDDDSSGLSLSVKGIDVRHEFDAPGFTIDLNNGKVTVKKGWTVDEASKVFWEHVQSLAQNKGRALTLSNDEAVILRRVLEGIVMVLREENSLDANYIENILKRL